jgi:serine protease
MKSNRASVARRLGAVALVLAVTPVFSACWPLAPIVAIAAAAGGGGGGGGGNKGVVLSGTIITDATVFDTTLSLDREPNDSLGTAAPVPPIEKGHARRIEGATELRASVHALVASAGGLDVVGRDLLDERARRFSTAPLGAAPQAIARRGNELFFVSGDGGRSQLSVTPLEGPFVKRRVDLALAVDAAGAALCLDALVVLDRTGGSSRLVAFDADDGRPLVLVDLDRDDLGALAGSDELRSGRTRLFAASDRGELFEIALVANGPDLRFGRAKSIGSPRGLSGGVAALGYDGALLQVIDGAGTLHSIEPDSLRELAARPLLAAGEKAVALVATLDLGFDGYRVDVAAGRTLHVELATQGDDPDGRCFFAAIDRATVAAATLPGPVALQRSNGSSQRMRLELSAPAGAPKSFDVIVGSLHGAASYELVIGAAAQLPSGAPDRARGDAARELAQQLDTKVLPALTADRLVEIYRDPLLPDFAPGRVVLGRTDAAATLALPPAPKGLALGRVSRSPAGWDVLSLATTTEFTGPAVRTLHGDATRRAARREEARAVLAALDGIAGAPGVAWSEPQFVAHSLATPNDPGYLANQTWNYGLLNCPNAWDISTGNANTVLAIVDTGGLTDNFGAHANINSDFDANVGTDGFDFVTGTNNGDGNGLDPDPYDPGTFVGNAHHGSHCGGTMGARGNNASQGTGINWNCTLMPVRALGTDGSGFTTDIADGILYAAKLANSSGTTPTNRAAVINLSLGLSSSSNAIHNALIAAVGQGCVVCCASGNDGNGTAVLFPAAYPEAIAVAACDPAANVAFYSNTGPELDITCPGGEAGANPANDIWSTTGVGGGNGSLQPLAGTSMACAHASGVCGLMATLNPALDQTTARSVLEGTAVDIDSPGFDNFTGFGLVDAAAALVGSVPVLTFDATTVDFGNTGTHLAVQAVNTGGGSLILTQPFALTSTYTPTGIPPTTAWLTASLLADGKTITFVADRTGLAAGDYQVQVDVNSNGGTGSILVGLTTGAGGVTNVGTVTIQISTQGGTLVKTTTAVAASNYAWSVNGLANVPYFVRCGVDNDGDGVLGEVGELFGAYPTPGNPQTLDLTALTGLQIDLLLQ